MRETTFGTILGNAARLAGRDVEQCAVPSSWKVLAALAINAGLDTLAAEKFPQMQRIEFRRYRPCWKADVTYSPGQETWHAGAYWRATGAPSGTATSTGEEPGTGDEWRRLDPCDVARFIAFDQPWENTVMQSFGLDTTRFAYVADPRYAPEATPIHGCRLCELGVLLPEAAPDGVYVRFVPEYPALDPSSDDWGAQTVRSEFAAYLTRLVAADLLTEDQGKYQTRAAADAELERLIERYHEGNGETRIRTGRFR